MPTFQILKFSWKITNRGDIGARVVVVAMGERRLEVIVSILGPRSPTTLKLCYRDALPNNTWMSFDKGIVI